MRKCDFICNEIAGHILMKIHCGRALRCNLEEIQ